MVISLARSAPNRRPLDGRARTPLRAAQDLHYVRTLDWSSQKRRATEYAPYHSGPRRPMRPTRQDGLLMVELLVGVAIVLATLLPLAYSFAAEHRLALASYQRAVAMEIVDGEMEALVAGEWRAYPPGTHDYRVHAGAATNLPPGKFTLTIQPDKIRLRWQPAVKDHGGPVTREARLK